MAGRIATVRRLASLQSANRGKSSCKFERNVIATKGLQADAAMITMIAVMYAERLENG
jgi:hypothetical protein